MKTDDVIDLEAVKEHRALSIEFDKREREIVIAHALVGMTMMDDEQLYQEVQRLTAGEFDRKEIADIIRFAALVAREQSQQLLEILVRYRKSQR